jgi:hypothetical protein
MCLRDTYVISYILPLGPYDTYNSLDVRFFNMIITLFIPVIHEILSLT